MTILYTAHATTIAGREGHTETDDKKISLDLSPPGSGKDGSNPEQLFACGYSACFGSAVAAVCKIQNVTATEIKVQADVNLHKDDSGYSISAVLNVTLGGVDTQTAKTVVEAAHQMCPYSKATRGNIQVELKVGNEVVKQAA